MARTHRDRAPLASLHHVLDLEWMLEAYRATRKDGAAGIDGATAADYAERLEDNLLDLLDRIKLGRSQAAHRCAAATSPRQMVRPISTAARRFDLRGQGGAARDRDAAGGHLRTGLPVLFVPALSFRPERSAHDALHEVYAGRFMTRGCGGCWISTSETVFRHHPAGPNFDASLTSR